jgi:hypothetical protein
MAASSLLSCISTYPYLHVLTTPALMPDSHSYSLSAAANLIGSPNPTTDVNTELEIRSCVIEHGISGNVPRHLADSPSAS